jgi:MFS family permease
MENINKNNYKILWIAASLFYSFQLVLRIFPNILVNQLSSDFGLTACELGLLSSAYYNAYALVQVPAGIFLDKFSVKSILLISMFCCLAGSLIFSVSNDIYIAYIARFLTGFGAGFALLSSIKSANLSTRSPKALSFMIGANFSLAMAFVGVNSTLINKVVNIFGWRNASLVFTAVLTILILIVFMTKTSEKSDKKKDFKTIVSEISQNCSNVFKNKQLYLLSFYGFCTYVPMSCFCDLWGSKFLNIVYGIEYGTSISICMTIYIGVAVGSVFWPYIAHITKSYKKVLILAEIILLICFSQLIIFKNITSIFNLYILLFIIGVSCSSTLMSYGLLSNLYGEKLAATANSIYNFSAMLSGVLFQPLIGKIIDYTQESLRIDAAQIAQQMGIVMSEDQILGISFTVAFYIFCTLPILALISTIFLKVPYGSVMKANS